MPDDEPSQVRIMGMGIERRSHWREMGYRLSLHSIVP
jgi:hypothetical protein